MASTFLSSCSPRQSVRLDPINAYRRPSNPTVVPISAPAKPTSRGVHPLHNKAALALRCSSIGRRVPGEVTNPYPHSPPTYMLNYHTQAIDARIPRALPYGHHQHLVNVREGPFGSVSGPPLWQHRTPLVITHLVMVCVPNVRYARLRGE
ncbi:hypothetical protein BDQ12DRAFT_729276 [Crucibulum laeve]|uniref:Uncharacterized protein n=1 Tax=Crucibulum laeve TaxID=68775 RepID=A0A5C3LG45_9AGAR|nr:hypothetical protein BDQ12DRAFT_729276 [Crucibulum laeve]